MGLVDLRGRADDSAVRAMLADAHGSPAGLARAVARYRAREWALVGWDEDGALVACAGLSREGDDIAVRSIAVAVDRRSHGVGRSLLDAVAAVATARRLVAETDEESAGFYRRCGFEVEQIEPKGGRSRFRCSRPIETRPATTDAVRAFTLGELECAIQQSWGRDTSDDPDEWAEDNPARGQCDITALVVRDVLGGEILVANVLRGGARVDRHAWNRLPSGLCLDLTRSQFKNGETFEEPAAGEPMLTDSARYELLLRRVQARLADIRSEMR